MDSEGFLATLQILLAIDRQFDWSFYESLGFRDESGYRLEPYYMLLLYWGTSGNEKRDSVTLAE